jgi:hypothetical protein
MMIRRTLSNIGYFIIGMVIPFLIAIIILAIASAISFIGSSLTGEKFSLLVPVANASPVIANTSPVIETKFF